MITDSLSSAGLNFLLPTNIQDRYQTGADLGSFGTVLKDRLGAISEDMDAIFEEAAAKFGISSRLIKAVAKTESNFNSEAVSHAGAMGVMQLMPGTARTLGVSDPYDARQNIMGGAKYLKANLDKFGDVSLALAAYNAGPGSVEKYGGIPPYSETQNYVRKVLSYMDGDALYANRTVTTGGGGQSAMNSLYAMNGMSGFPGLGGISGLGRNSTYGLGSLFGLAGGDAAMDQESYASLIQILQLQMMMNATRETGNLVV